MIAPKHSRIIFVVGGDDAGSIVNCGRTQCHNDNATMMIVRYDLLIGPDPMDDMINIIRCDKEKKRKRQRRQWRKQNKSIGKK